MSHSRLVLCLVALLLLLAGASLAHLHGDGEHGHLTKDPEYSRQLNNFEIVTRSAQVKTMYHTAQKTFKRSGRGSQPFPDQLRLVLDAFNTTFNFELEVNQDLLHPDISIKVFGKKETWTSIPSQRFYKGTATSSFGTGWARLTLHGESEDTLTFEGAFVQDGELFQVKPTDKFHRMKIKNASKRYDRKRLDHGDVDMIIYREADVEVLDPEAEKCGLDDTHFNSMMDAGHLPHDSYNLDGFDLQKRASEGCPTSTKVLYMGVASDCTYTASLGADEDATQTQILNNWNLVSALYESTFNIGLGIISIYIRKECGATPADPAGGVLTWNVACSSGYTISNRLSDFSQWRGSQNADAGLWHLMSTCPTGSTIGIAWLNMLCTTQAFDQSGSSGTEYVSGTGVTTSVSNEWVVVAHEIGHNFGAKHDCTNACTAGDTSCCNCSPGCSCNAQYIMNPSNSIGSNTFSPCSQTTMCSRSSVTGSCLATPGTRSVLNINVCGNGVLEPPNEECDCGGEEACLEQNCCFANCTLVPDAVCADVNSACCQNCTVVNSVGTILCRPEEGECDVPEYCDGQNAACPTDGFKEDGTTCTAIQEAYCASGKCTNRAEQCRVVGLLNDRPDVTKDCLGSCRLFCSDAFNECRYFPGFFLNGTKCGNDGICEGGICSTGDPISKLLDFIQKNLILVIVGASILGILILGFLFWGCRRANRKDVKLGRSIANMTQRFTMRRRGGAAAAQTDVPSTPPPSGRPAGRSSNAQAPQGRQSRSSNASAHARAHRDSRTPAPAANRLSQHQEGRAYSQGSDAPLRHGSRDSANISSNISSLPPDYSEVQLQVRCPVCQKMFANETAVDQHLDTDH